VLDEMPELDEESTRQCDDPGSSMAPASAEAFLEPTAEAALGLVPEPQPGEFDHPRADSCVACLADSLLALGLAGIERRPAAALSRE